MGTILHKHFASGLDARRLPETTSSDALVRCQDAHINRGGEVEQRAAFPPIFALPAGTTGMAFTASSVVVFSESAITGLPVGVVLQQLVNPDNAALRLARILSTELFAGQVYAIAQFEDGSTFHFYNGVRVPDWDEKRARTSFVFTGGLQQGSVSSITVGGLEILGAVVAYTGSPVTMAQALSDQINAFQSSVEYVAAAFGGTLAILAATDGTTANGLAVTMTAQNVSFTGGAALAGGIVQNGSYGQGSITITGADNTLVLNELTVNGVDILGEAVKWNTDIPTTVVGIVDQINAFASTPDYTATAVGPTVVINPVDIGAGSNGFAVLASWTGTFTYTPQTVAGGVSPTYQSGAFVRSGNKKLFSLTGGDAHFSGLQTPASWIDGEATGAGFITMSNEASNVDTLTSIAKYQNYYAFFSDRTIQIWYNDPDPSLNKQLQVLANTGTSSPQSVVQYGDNDVFYLDESGVRSLRARDASNAAATTDTGVPIDNLIVEVLQSLSNSERQAIFSVIEPSSGRYWLAIGQTIYVFSSFAEASINAWSTYTLPFPVEQMAVNRRDRRVYVRSGNTIYVYGGTGPVPVYDDTPVVVWLPYEDAEQPRAIKTFTGLDIAARGQWEILVGLDVTDQNATDRVGRFDGTTFNSPGIGGVGQGSHIQLRLTSIEQPADGGPCVLGAVAVHYEGDGHAT